MTPPNNDFRIMMQNVSAGNDINVTNRNVTQYRVDLVFPALSSHIRADAEEVQALDHRLDQLEQAVRTEGKGDKNQLQEAYTQLGKLRKLLRHPANKSSILEVREQFIKSVKLLVKLGPAVRGALLDLLTDKLFEQALAILGFTPQKVMGFVQQWATRRP